MYPVAGVELVPGVVKAFGSIKLYVIIPFVYAVLLPSESVTCALTRHGTYLEANLTVERRDKIKLPIRSDNATT